MTSAADGTRTADGTSTVDGTEGRLRDEITAATRSGLRTVHRRRSEIVLGLAVLLTALSGLALLGAALDDAAIDRNRGVAGAEVLAGSGYSRTLIRFTVAGGQAVVPELGVFHPRGLRPGDMIAVEYDRTDPELVRVAGRSALDAVPLLALGVAVVWLVLGPLAWWLDRRRFAGT